MVDWGVARQIARFAARSEDAPGLGVDLPAMTRELEAPVSGYVGLGVVAVPEAEVVDRASWAEANVTTLSTLLDPVAVRLGSRLDAAGPFAGALRMGAGVTLAAEVGLVTGYMSQHVLGQYDVSLLRSESPPRLLFVAPNLHRAVVALNVDRESFLRWVVTHELVHALQFGGVPWLRDHLGALLRAYLETADVRIDRGAAGGLPTMPNPTELVARFREGGLAALVQTSEQRQIIDRLQATMAVVEGHAEHVMDALAPELVPEHEGLREAMDQRRDSRSGSERVLLRLLGMEMKMRQYRLGKAFCDAVVSEGGVEALNRVWDNPDALPSLDELEAPEAWLSRVAAPA